MGVAAPRQTIRVISVRLAEVGIHFCLEKHAELRLEKQIALIIAPLPESGGAVRLRPFAAAGSVREELREKFVAATADQPLPCPATPRPLNSRLLCGGA